MVFTGIVTRVALAQYDVNTFKLCVKAPGFFEKSSIGDSVCINGVCLTIEELDADNSALFGVMQETRNRTNIALYEPGEWKEVNLEPSLRLGDQLGGHKVQGHVDVTAPICEITPNADGSRDIWIDLSQRSPKEVENQKIPIVHKGSICLDGTSLTVARWLPDEEKLKVSIIPHTLVATTLGKKKCGDLINVEFDCALKEPNSLNWDVEKTDEDFMLQAIELGEKGRVTAPPNPWVACVLVKQGRVIGKGYHAKAGTAHAEVVALQNAKDTGATDEDIKGTPS